MFPASGFCKYTFAVTDATVVSGGAAEPVTWIRLLFEATNLENSCTKDQLCHLIQLDKTRPTSLLLRLDARVYKCIG